MGAVSKRDIQRGLGARRLCSEIGGIHARRYGGRAVLRHVTRQRFEREIRVPEYPSEDTRRVCNDHAFFHI